MYYTVTVESDNQVNIDFSDDQVIREFERNIKRNDTCLNEEEQKIIKDAINILHKNEIEFKDITAYVKEAEIDEDDICDAYNSCDLKSDTDTYDDGYEAAQERVEQQNNQMKFRYGTLYNKLNHLVYNFGKQEQLTDNDIHDILKLLEYKYDFS